MQQTMPLGESFRFYVKGNENVIYTAYKVDGCLLVSVTWKDHVRVLQRTSYSVESVRKYIESGAWEILPSTTNTPPKPSPLSDEDSFTLAEKAVNAALFPVKEAVAEGLLDTIKAFTASGKYNVAIYKGGYTVYCPNDEYRATTDKQLLRVMDAVKVLSQAQEGAV